MFKGYSMKSVSVKTQSSLQSLLSKDDSTQNYTDHKSGQQTKITVLPPGEKLLSYLNDLGQQYPFCVAQPCSPHLCTLRLFAVPAPHPKSCGNALPKPMYSSRVPGNCWPFRLLSCHGNSDTMRHGCNKEF
jgi:hypothetical protein